MPLCTTAHGVCLLQGRRLPMKSLGRSRGPDLAVLLMAFAILMGVCSFIVVAYGVSAGITQHLDEELLKAPRDPAVLCGGSKGLNIGPERTLESPAA